MVKTMEEKYSQLNRKTPSLLLKNPTQCWDEWETHIQTQHHENFRYRINSMSEKLPERKCRLKRWRNKNQADIWQSQMCGILTTIEQNRVCKVLRKKLRVKVWRAEQTFSSIQGSGIFTCKHSCLETYGVLWKSEGKIHEREKWA